MTQQTKRESLPATKKIQIIAGTVIACVGLVVLGACGIFMSADRWHDLGRLLTTPAGEGSAFGIALLLAGLWVRARYQAPPALVLLVALAASTLVVGCGSAIAAGATGVDVAGRTLAPVMTWAHDTRAAELDACHDEPCLDAGEARWAPVVAALNAARDSLAAILDALELVHAHAADAPPLEILVGLARTAVDAWHAADDVARAMGRGVPPPPDEVVALAGGAS